MSKIHYIQHGTDGMGHQLHGLFSCLLLHDIKNYYFDGNMFVNKIFVYQHVEGSVSNDIKNYMIEIGKKFIKISEQTPILYKNYSHAHEVYNIPTNYDTNTIYSLDNAYYFDKIPINNDEKSQLINNIKKCKELFINDKLPKNRLQPNNIVIHLRLGDAMTTGRGSQINKYNNQIIKVIHIFIKKYHNYIYYFHTDGDADFLTDILNKNKINYKLFLKKEHILNVFSDFIHSKIFIAGCSSLSTVSTFLGNKELTIISDDIKHSVPDNVVRITDYVANNS